MAKKNYMVKSRCSYGEKGEIIDLDGDLTERQKAMLVEYKKPVAKKSGKDPEVEKLKGENAELTAKIAELEKTVEDITTEIAKANEPEKVEKTVKK